VEVTGLPVGGRRTVGHLVGEAGKQERVGDLSYTARGINCVGYIATALELGRGNVEVPRAAGNQRGADWRIRARIYIQVTVTGELAAVLRNKWIGDISAGIFKMVSF